MALTHKEAEQLAQKLYRVFSEVAAPDPKLHGMNGFAIGSSDYETGKVERPRRAERTEKAFCVTVMAGKGLSEEKKAEMRECADEMFRRKTDESDLNFRTILKVTLH